METMTSNSAARTGASGVEKAVDTAADKVHGVLHDAQAVAHDASASAASKLDGLASQARHVVDSAGDLAKQGIAAVNGAAKQTRSSVAGSSEALVGYTKDYPMRALMIAAASGALLWSVLKAVAASRRS